MTIHGEACVLKLPNHVCVMWLSGFLPPFRAVAK